VIGNSGIFHISDCTTTPAITVTSPHAGSDWCLGSAYTITWTKSGDMQNTVVIRLKTPGAVTTDPPVTEISAGTTNDGSFSWTIPSSVPTGDYVLWVRTLDSTVIDDSAAFEIRNCAGTSYVVTSPAEGDTFHTGQHCTVSWNTPVLGAGRNDEIIVMVSSGDNRRHVPIKFLRNRPGEHHFTWQVLAHNFHGFYGDYKIRIVKKSDYQALGEGSRFRIEENPDASGAPPPGASSEQRDDLEIGPVYAPDVTLTRVSYYGGGGYNSENRDRYHVTINFRIRNNTGPNRPEISSVPCTWTLYNRRRNDPTAPWTSPLYNSPGTIHLGPFQSKSGGDWTRCTATISLFLYEKDYESNYPKFPI
jgi:hypothetical protein